MTENVVQLSIPGMAGRRRPSTPAQYGIELRRRTKAAREAAGLTREELVSRLSERTGRPVNLETYKKWETRGLIPHDAVVPFCEITGMDAYELLSGEPFRIGRRAAVALPVPFRKAKVAN